MGHPHKTLKQAPLEGVRRGSGGGHKGVPTWKTGAMIELSTMTMTPLEGVRRASGVGTEGVRRGS
eukprot:686948-Prorocentrum_minimum.AAC.1